MPVIDIWKVSDTFNTSPDSVVLTLNDVRETSGVVTVGVELDPPPPHAKSKSASKITNKDDSNGLDFLVICTVKTSTSIINCYFLKKHFWLD